MFFLYHAPFLLKPVYTVKVLIAQISHVKFVQNRMKDFGSFVLKKTITYDII